MRHAPFTLGRILAIAFAAPMVIALAVGIGPEHSLQWWTLSALSRNAWASLALAANTAILVLAASVLPERRAVPAAIGFVAGSWATWAVIGTQGMLTCLPAHMLALLAATGTIALRAWTKRLCSNPLDAAGATLLLTAVALGAGLAIGPALPLVPAWLIDLTLRINPVVAVTAAAGIDLLRMDVFYSLTPVAHWSFNYPSTIASFALFGGVAAVLASCHLALDRLVRRR